MPMPSERCACVVAREIFIIYTDLSAEAFTVPGTIWLFELCGLTLSIALRTYHRRRRYRLSGDQKDEPRTFSCRKASAMAWISS